MLPVLQTFSHYPGWPVPGDLALPSSDLHPCSYLPGRSAQIRGCSTDLLPADAYQMFMDAGFRRSGRLIYQPICPSCRSCRPLRVRVDDFSATRSQRRCLVKNRDLKISISEPKITEEKFSLYDRYQRLWHGKQDGSTWEDFSSFLYESPTATIEFCYRDNTGILVAVGLCDVTRSALSSVYFYFDPASSDRGLGTYGALREIDHAKKESLQYYYLGYYIYACDAMAYKANYRPHEFLDTDGVWRKANGQPSSQDVPVDA